MRTIIGVMGPGNQATPTEIKTAYGLGKAIAQEGWILLTGGRNVGVMDAASRGARAAQGLTIGVLPSDNWADMSSAVDIPIVTGMGHGRNIINVLTSHVLIACGHGAGTASEIAIALKTGTPIIFISADPTALTLWQGLSASPLQVAPTVDQAIARARECLA